MEQTPIGIPEVLFCDEHVLIASKPNRLLVHRSNIDYYEKKNLLSWLKKETGLWLQPAHRLDKATSGVIAFGLTPESHAFLRAQFNERTIQKTYTALVRGYTPESGEIDFALQADDDDREREALTRYRTTHHVEIDIPIGRYPTSRFSLVEAYPETGRFHQIRLHFKKIRHPIIGDHRHGDRKHNHWFAQELELEALFLHASSLTLRHPNGNLMTFNAPLPNHFQTIQQSWNWQAGASADAHPTGNHRL